jgi:hypothetical protein
MRKREVMNSITKELNAKKNRYCRITHKQGWLDFLVDGDPLFKIDGLHQVLRKAIDTDEMRPRGEKLLTLRRRSNFTVRTDKTPYRTEEALERLIVVSNPRTKDYEIWNQVPIGGGKESADLGFKEGAKFTFIELKAWDSGDSPLYAVMESLKNLVEYEIIQKRKLKDPLGQEIEICVLAPADYYRKFALLDQGGNIAPQEVEKITNLLRKLGKEFNTRISLKSLNLNESEFQSIIRNICKRERVERQTVVGAREEDSILSWKKDNWALIASSY